MRALWFMFYVLRGSFECRSEWCIEGKRRIGKYPVAERQTECYRIIIGQLPTAISHFDKLKLWRSDLNFWHKEKSEIWELSVKMARFTPFNQADNGAFSGMLQIRKQLFLFLFWQWFHRLSRFSLCVTYDEVHDQKTRKQKKNEFDDANFLRGERSRHLEQVENLNSL